MRLPLPLRTLALLPLLSVLALAPGCLKPDKWLLTPADYDRRVDDKALESFQVPDQMKPVKDEPRPPAIDPARREIDLSVEQAALMALQGNRDLMVRQFQPVIAGTFEQIERGAYDPELFAELYYAEQNSEDVSSSLASRFRDDTRQRGGTAGLRQRLPTGTSLEVSLSQEGASSNREPDLESTRLGLSVTQSLLRGFGPVVNLVGVRQAELGAQASRYELRGFTEATLAEAEMSYWDYVRAEREIAIFSRSLEVARQQLDEIEQRISVGVLPKIEAAAARAEVARREQDMIDAKSTLEDRRLKLLRQINPGGGLAVRVRPTSRPDIAARPVTDLDQRMILAERQRPDLNEARLRWKQNRLETIATRNGLLPKLELFAALGQTGYSDSFGDSFSKLDGPTNDFYAGLRLSHFLGNREARARNTAALASARQAKAAVENLRQQVRLDVRLAANQVERIRQQISATRLTRELQEQTVAAENERFDVGKSTALLVAQAQRDLVASRINEVQAVIYYRIALVKLFLAEGSLLERRGVTLGGK